MTIVLANMDSRRKHVTLRDGTEATVFSVRTPEELPKPIIKKMTEMYNHEVSGGQTFPLEELLTEEDFATYWIPPCCGIMVAGRCLEVPSDGESVLATYFVKKNYPYGRCSHICNTAMMVSTGARMKGIGRILGACLLQDAANLGFTYVMLNLVFITNIASQKAWEAIGFNKIGRIPRAVRAEGFEEPVDALIYGRSLP